MITDVPSMLNYSKINFNTLITYSRNNQHYAMICITPLFYILAPTCFGSSLPSSGIFLIIFRLIPYTYYLYMNISILLFYHLVHVIYIINFYYILIHCSSCCYCIHSICFILHKMLYILILLPVIYFRYTTQSICISSNSEGSKKLPDDGRLLPKHVGASI
jgi:hypothetical protein